MPQYYVAQVDKRTQREIVETRVECKTGLDAGRALQVFSEQFPKEQYIVIAVLSEQERHEYRHACRQCDCQFDARNQLVTEAYAA